MGEEVFVDSNIFLEIFLDQEKADSCEQFLRSSHTRNIQLVSSDFVIYSCLIIVNRTMKSFKQIEDAIILFNNQPNMRILRPSFKDLYIATKIIEKTKLDFDDSLVVACMENNNIKKLASLDKHFDKVKGIERIKL